MSGSPPVPPPSEGGARSAQYRRVLREVAGRRVVDEAEDTLARSWSGQLDEMRRAALSLLATARMASNAARAEVRLAAESGRLGELAVAQARLQSIEAAQDGNLREARAFLESVDAELELLCAAGTERARRARADRDRLRIAWRAAFGDGPQPEEFGDGADDPGI